VSKAVGWAERELLTAGLGDERLDKRAAKLLTSLGNRPNVSIPAACGGHAETQAAYRFFDNRKVTFQKVLAPHLQRTQERMAAQDLVLLVQDTTELDLSRPTRPVKGAGPLDGSRRGLLLHEQHAFTAGGTPLGTVDAQILCRQMLHRDAAEREPSVSHRKWCRQTPLEQKESVRWIQGLRRARQVAAQLPGTRCISVADSEADLYEWFAEPRAEADQTPALDWIVRACHDRLLEDQQHQHVQQAALATPVLYRTKLKVRARRTRMATRKNLKRKRQTSRRARTARVQVRAATLTLRPPWREGGVKLPAVTVNVVLVSETRPPKGEPPVQWLLITTLPVASVEQVRSIVKYYCVRWNIELLFRTLKGGCRIEQRRLETTDRMLPCLALYLIVAWRTQWVCRLSREHPDADCQVLLAPSEWKSVWKATQGKLPKQPPKLSLMVRLSAALGGYIAGPGREPGVQTVWIGLQRMRDLAWAWDAFGPGS